MKNTKTEKTEKKLYGDMPVYDLTYADVKEMRANNLDPRLWDEDQKKDENYNEKWLDFVISKISARHPEIDSLGYRAAVQYATDAYIMTFGGEEALKNS